MHEVAEKGLDPTLRHSITHKGYLVVSPGEHVIEAPADAVDAPITPVQLAAVEHVSTTPESPVETLEAPDAGFLRSGFVELVEPAQAGADDLVIETSEAMTQTSEAVSEQPQVKDVAPQGAEKSKPEAKPEKKLKVQKQTKERQTKQT